MAMIVDRFAVVRTMANRGIELGALKSWCLSCMSSLGEVVLQKNDGSIIRCDRVTAEIVLANLIGEAAFGFHYAAAKN